MQALKQNKTKSGGEKRKCSPAMCTVFIYEGGAGHDGDRLPFNNVK